MWIPEEYELTELKKENTPRVVAFTQILLMVKKI